jgi:type 1 glutamine amidotransferase
MRKKSLIIASVMLFLLAEMLTQNANSKAIASEDKTEQPAVSSSDRPDQKEQPTKKALVLTERGGQHGSFTDAAMKFLAENAKSMQMEFVEINNTEAINDAYLQAFKLIIQLDYPPYSWTKEAEQAFMRYIDEGRGGWIGFHHATLLGEFDGYPLWHWFSEYMGGIRFKNYIREKADGKVVVEDREHPIMKGVGGSFVIPDDEWYTFDRNPRPNVQVLATVDESSYQIKQNLSSAEEVGNHSQLSDNKADVNSNRSSTNVLMGDHPAIWTNPYKPARNVYFLMGHSGKLFEVEDFTTMFRNAVEWTSLSAQESEKFYKGNYAGKPRFKALVYYSEHVEEAHVKFAQQGVEFFKKLNYGNGFTLDITQDLSAYGYEKLMEYDVVIMLNNSPNGDSQRADFEKYMEDGGGWIGFHAAAYNDRNTHWPWFVRFLGGGVFDCNTWPPQPVKLVIDNQQHPVTKNLPAAFIAPESEWYVWQPNPRTNPDIEVLLTISPDNYPLGIKDVISYGDFPVVWTNKRYRMIYLNMGHGDDEFSDATQKLLFVNALRWIVSRSSKGDPFKKRYR